MKKHIVAIVGIAIGVLIIVSCKGLSTSTNTMSTDSVTISKETLADTTYFKLTSGGKCDIIANATFCYPKAYRDAKATEALQSLFTTNVLELADTIEFDQSFKKYIAGVLHQYGISENERPEDVEDDYESVYQYASNTTISPVYNKNGVLTFCKAELTTKNGKQTMSTHRYSNFDLEQMKLIEFNDLFIESSTDDLTMLIKSNLMKQLNAKTEDDVINMGYFNLDNLKPTTNFSIGSDGITWTYLPYEIALLSVGETNITVKYDELEMLMQDNDLVARIKH